MKLTDAERVILYRLHEVLAELQPKEAKRHETKMEMLLEGYHEQHYTFDLSKPISKSDADFVRDVLDLYRALNGSFKALPAKARKDIDAKSLAFPGFDANDPHELTLLGFAQFQIAKLGHWAELKQTAAFNSHRLMAGVYSRMLERARKIGARRYDLSAEEIKAILDGPVSAKAA